jgi:glycosyltransferase involved in cell wall biosynthesis
MRILMACAAFPPFIDGGGPISALMVAKLLQQSGHDLEVVNVADREVREVYEGVPVQRLSTLNIDWNYRLPRPAWKRAIWHLLENFNPRAFVVMRRQIRRFRPDVVLTDSIENINVATWLAARTCGVPVCHILRSTFLLCWKGSMRKTSGNCGTACGSCQASSIGKKLMSRFVDAVIGETAFIIDKHLAHNYFPNASRHVVAGLLPNPITAKPRDVIADRPIRIGYLGVLDAIKGLDTLAAALATLDLSMQPEVLIAGTAKSQYAKNLPAKFPAATEFLGWVRPDDLFRKIDILVVPSLFEEPFGRVIVEAFAAGIPVIGARSGGIPETIDPGINGLLFPAGDVAALADILRDLSRDPAQIAAMSKGALNAAQRYSPERIGAAYNAAFASVCVDNHRQRAMQDAPA